jgi:hypothetical protein
MNSPVHFVVGAAICRHTRNKPLGFALALASHFVLDAIPHIEDPWLLPHRGAVAGVAQWTHLLWSVQMLTGLLALVTAWRLRALGWEPRAMLYPLSGGALAVSPDILTTLLGYNNPIGWLNDFSHVGWHPLVGRAIAAFPLHVQTIGAVLVAIEAGVLVVGSWWLWRRASEQPGEMTTAEETP